jgi:hypothetical protein
MSYYVNKKVELEMYPGQGKASIEGEFSEDIILDSAPAASGKISFKCTCSQWLALVNCSGGGEIIGTAHKTKINGKNGIKNTDIGVCRGKGDLYTPNGKIVVPCICVMRIKYDDTNIQTGAGSASRDDKKQRNKLESGTDTSTGASISGEIMPVILPPIEISEKEDLQRERDNFEAVSLIEKFEQQVFKWREAHPAMIKDMNRLSRPEYSLKEGIVFNENLKKIKDFTKIKYILVADNPGKDEQESGKYLIGNAGIRARNFFTYHKLVEDFDQEVIVLNKTPIHTKQTSDLALLNRYRSLIDETQVYMADLAFQLQKQIYCQLWILGISELKGIFKPFTRALKDKYQNDDMNNLVFCYSHFSMGRFHGEFNKEELPNETEPDQIPVLKLFNIGKRNREKHLGL